MISTRRTHNRTRPGFSLVEVLIAVLILAIGLLGLGAVIPVVVREQRLAADATIGVAVANAAKSVLTGPQMGAHPRVSVWDAMLDDPQWSRNQRRYEWELWQPDPPARTWADRVDIHSALREVRNGMHGFDHTLGRYVWSNRVQRFQFTNNSWMLTTTSSFPGVGDGDFYSLELRDRLWPSPAVLGTGNDQHRPQFVWDFVARRVDTRIRPGDREHIDVPAEIQLVIFVRRIDMNIRVPQGMTLYQVLSDPTLADVNRRLPVAVDSTGAPTLNGSNGTRTPTRDAYAVPRTLRVSLEDPSGPRRELRLEGDAVSRLLASQIGQRLVDNLGNIHTVREVIGERAGGTIVRIEHSISESIPPGNDPDFGTIRQVVFTPQVPASVQLLSIQRPVIQP